MNFKFFYIVTVCSVLLINLSVNVAQDPCSFFNFKCGDGACTNYYDQCNAENSCSDGSDESSATCPAGSDYMEGEYLLVSDDIGTSSFLYQVDVSTGRVRQIQNATVRPIGVAIDNQTNNLYYMNADASQPDLRAYDWSTKSSRILYSGIARTSASKIQGVAVSITNGVVYYANNKDSLIGEVKISDGTYRTIQSGISPVALVYDEVHNNLYYTDTGTSTPGIYMCSVGPVVGTSTGVITTGVSNTQCLAIDFSAEIMYWIDSTTCLLESAEVSGANRKTLMELDEGHYLYLTVTQHNLFYLYYDLFSTQYAVSAFERKRLTRHRYANQRFQNLKSLASNVRDAATCMLDYVHCEAADAGCVYKYEICDGVNHCEDDSDETTLCPGGRKEYMQDDYLIVADRLHQSFYQVNPVTGEVIHITEATASRPYIVAFDLNSQYLYFGDDGEKVIKRFSMITKIQEVVFQPQEFSCSGIALDTRRGFLYVAVNTQPSKIWEINLADRSQTRVVYEGADIVPCCGMAFDPDTRILYWPDNGAASAILSISVEPNSQIVTVVGGLSAPDGFAADFVTGQIFWTSSISSTLETCNLDGSNHQIVHQSLFILDQNMIALDSKYIYLVGPSSSRVTRLDRTNGYEEYQYPDQSFAFLTGVVHVKLPTFTSTTTETTTTTATTEVTTTSSTTYETTTNAQTDIPTTQTTQSDGSTTQSGGSTIQSGGSTIPSEGSSTQSGGSIPQSTQVGGSTTPSAQSGGSTIQSEGSTTQSGGSIPQSTQLGGSTIPSEGSSTQSGGSIPQSTQSGGSTTKEGGSTTQSGGSAAQSTQSGGSTTKAGGSTTKAGGSTTQATQSGGSTTRAAENQSNEDQYRRIIIIVVIVVCVSAIATFIFGLCCFLQSPAPEPRRSRARYNGY